MIREAMIEAVERHGAPWDLVIVGGGATGIGIALDAASRGHDVLLLERADFGKGTSSRSTKLVHGGVRYLRQGRVGLVTASLRERELLRANAPHVVSDLAFVVPSYSRWDSLLYGAGLKTYGLLAGRTGFGATALLSREETLRRLPALAPSGLRGGVVYHDGLFDDARLLLDLARTAHGRGAVLVNYAPVVSFTRAAGGRVDGAVFRDLETGREHAVRARGVVNATGAFCDGVRRLAEPSSPPLVSPSQGIHVVLDRAFLPGDAALVVPRTDDGRVLFAIPWHGRVLVGTTDTPVGAASEEPAPRASEIDFVLGTAGRYLAKAPARADVLSTFAGIRPLVRARGARSTAALARDHTIEIGPSGLLTITGGKWTTYRSMAEDAVTRAAAHAGLPARPCVTRTLRIEAPPEDGDALVRGIRHEMARCVEDLLARRTRTLFLDARAALAAAPSAAGLLAKELGRDEAWARGQVEAFTMLARGYLPTS